VGRCFPSPSWISLAVLAASGLIAAAASNGCSTQSCTLVGCSSIAAYQATVSVPEGAMELHLSACRNGACATGVYDLSQPGCGEGCGAGCVLVGQPGWDYCAVTPLGDGQWQLSFEYGLDTNVGVVQSGDIYAFAIATESAPLLEQTSEPVQYEEFYPNGEDCDETPCIRTTLTFKN
jgi:hypothetical protein